MTSKLRQLGFLLNVSKVTAASESRGEGRNFACKGLQPGLCGWGSHWLNAQAAASRALLQCRLLAAGSLGVARHQPWVAPQTQGLQIPRMGSDDRLGVGCQGQESGHQFLESRERQKQRFGARCGAPSQTYFWKWTGAGELDAEPW